MSELNFDATQVAPDTGVSDPVPAGWYNAIVDESEIKPTKDGNGARLACRLSILDGQYVNRKIFVGFNIRNANPVAQEIAFKQLSALAHAVGVLQVKDSSQLHGIPLKIRVKVRAASGDYDASNDVTAYKNINENVGAPTGAAGPAAAPQAPAGFGAPAAPAAPAAAAPVAPSGWQPPQAAQPWQQGGAPAAPAAPPAPPAFNPPAPPTPVFPPEGWTAHPSSPGYFYKGQEVKSEAELRAMVAPPAAPTGPVPTAPAPAPTPDPAATAGAATPPWQQPKA